MNPIKRILLYFTLLILQCNCWSQQKVGLVLSGGGATGLAHIGVLKAIEEKGIRIDYITGTSAGALVGAMYAVGYSPQEMEQYVLSDDFQLMTTGKLNPKQEYLYRNQEENAGMINFSFAQDSILKKSLPTNFITSTFLDFEMLKLFGVPGAMNGNNFDSLMIPFRCVASDIVDKSSIIFGTGDLNAAIRASMTYPFYFNPIRVDGKLMFDGGLYNNFPADVMYTTFSPDFILGSNVSGNAAPPSEDDLISQITNMLVSYSDFNLPCSSGIIIRPKTTIATFEFDQVRQAIDDGYRSAKIYLDSIDMTMVDTISKEELYAKRNSFRTKTNSIYIDAISNNKIKRNDLFFVRNSILRTHKKEVIDFNKLEKRYYRLYSAPQIDFLYPTLRLQHDSLYKLNLDVRKVKDFRLDAGGHFSSRAVNTGYVGIDYRRIGTIATNLHGDSYFGKFYGSAALRLDVDLPLVLPITFSPYLTLNRWDYFRSLATFFEDVKPSFLVQYEMYYGVKLKYPIGNTAKSSFDIRSFALENDYYQTSNFTSKDTTDITQFYGNSISWDFEKNTLNRKQYATSGHYFKLKARYIYGMEKTIPGSTSLLKVIDQNMHDWINLSATFQSFLVDKEHLHIGVHGQGVFNSQSLFSNYTSTLLMMNSFELVPDAATYFLPEYRSPQHVGAGFNLVLSPYKNIDLRFDGYFYQPFVVLQKNTYGEPSYSKPFKGETYIASLTAIYHSLVGPMRATINYFPKQAIPLNIQLSYGYVLFNERALR